MRTYATWKRFFLAHFACIESRNCKQLWISWNDHKNRIAALELSLGNGRTYCGAHLIATGYEWKSYSVRDYMRIIARRMPKRCDDKLQQFAGAARWWCGLECHFILPFIIMKPPINALILWIGNAITFSLENALQVCLVGINVMKTSSTLLV